MSGIFKSIKKAFKKVTSSVIGKIIIAVAITYFTAGIGSAFLLSAGSSLPFLGTTMGTVLSYGISGAVAGGLTSAVTGGNIGKGILMGAAGGAVTGGVSSALGITAASTAGLAPAAAPGAATTPGAGPNVGFNVGGNVGGSLPPGVAQAAANAGTAAPAAIPAAANTAATAPTNGLLSQAGNFITKNQTLLGGALKGVGAAFANDDDEENAMKVKVAGQKELEASQAARIAANHGSLNGLLQPGNNNLSVDPSRPTPDQKFDPSYQNGQWVYDPGKGRTVFIKNQPEPAAQPQPAAA